MEREKEIKQLKGADKDKATALQASVKAAAEQVVKATLHSEFVPYVRKWVGKMKAGELPKRPEEVENVFCEQSAILRLRDSAEPEAVQEFIERCQNATETLRHVSSVADMTAADAQACLVKWREDHACLLRIFSHTPGAILDLKPVLEEFTGLVSESLQGNVHGKAFDTAMFCLEITTKFIRNEKFLMNAAEDLQWAKMKENAEECRRLSTVMGDDGKDIRKALTLFQSLAFCGYRLQLGSDVPNQHPQCALLNQDVVEAIGQCVHVFHHGDRRQKMLEYVSKFFKLLGVKLAEKPEFNGVQDDIVAYMDKIIETVDQKVKAYSKVLEEKFVEAKSQMDVCLEIPDTLRNLTTLNQMWADDVVALVQETFAKQKSEVVTAAAVLLESVEAGTKLLAEQSETPEATIFVNIQECASLRRDWLSWLPGSESTSFPFSL